MRSSLLFALLVGIVSVHASCDEDVPEATGETVALSLALSGKVGRQDLALESQTYLASEAAEGFRVSRVSMYLSDIRLVENVGGRQLATDVAEVGYFRLDAGGEATMEFQNVPVGDYSGIRFNVGLTAEQDATVPAEWAATHPLGRASEYWNDWGSYIFMKLEGRADTLADGMERYDASFVYHVGKSPEFAREVEVAYALPLNDNNQTIALELDLATLLGLDSAEPLSVVSSADHRNDAADRIMSSVGEAIRPAR